MPVETKLIDNIEHLRKSIEKISVYNISTYSMLELYYSIARKLNEVISELLRFEVTISDEIIEQNKKLTYLLNDGLKIEVVKKINEMVLDGTFDTIINEVIFAELNNKIDTYKKNETYKNVRDYNCNGDFEEDSATLIQKVLNLGGNIYIPAGEYRIDKQLIIKEGTHLLMDNEAILYNNIHQSQPKGLKGISVLSNYDVDYPVNGYNLASNFKITGGKIIGVKHCVDKEILSNLGDVGQEGISISHGKNIVIENVNVKDIFRGHGIEITACDNVVVDNCIIDGCILTDLDITRVREAIQVEHSAPNTSPSLQDNTVSKNITIQNCTVTRTNINSQYWGSGIGSHNNDNISVIENIVIDNNKIYNCTHAGVMIINFKNSRIINNKISDCARGIGYYQARPMSNVIIDNNTIENCERDGILLYNQSYDITISNNKFTNIQMTAINGTDLIFLKIYNNRFLNCAIDGVSNGVILTYGLKNSIIENNFFDKTVSNGVKSCLFLADTTSLKNKDTVQINNKINFECTSTDMYISGSIKDNNSLLTSNFNIFDNSTLTLKRSIFNFNLLQMTVDIGGINNIVIPVTVGDNKVVISDISQSINSFSVVEFTINVDPTGTILKIIGTRYMTITDGVQTTRDISEGLQMKITKIIGLH